MAQDRRVHALVYFCSVVDDLLGAVLYWNLDLGFADMTKDEALKLALVALDIVKLHYTQNRYVNEAIAAIKEALAQPEPDLTIVYQSGYYDGKKDALAKREWNFCERCGKRTADLTTIHTCTPPQENT
jgi:hypothetical protein